MSVAVSIDDVSMSFGRGSSQTLALSHVSLSVERGEFLCILGRSGCGKSTLLSLVAGLERPSSGAIDVAGLKVAMMFQDAELFSWLTVAGNLRLALRLSGVPRARWDDRVAELLALVRLPDAANRRPHELSGGMRQRIALARALAQECDVLLMDEPFAALDAITRDSMHEEIERIATERALTVIFVTHNVREAVRLGDRVIVMQPTPGTVASELVVELPRPRQMDDVQIAQRAADLHSRLDAQTADYAGGTE